MKMKHLALAWRSWLHVYNQVRKICVCQRLEKSKWSWTRYLVHVEAYNEPKSVHTASNVNFCFFELHLANFNFFEHFHCVFWDFRGVLHVSFAFDGFCNCTSWNSKTRQPRTATFCAIAIRVSFLFCPVLCFARSPTTSVQMWRVEHRNNVVRARLFFLRYILSSHSSQVWRFGHIFFWSILVI